MKTVELIKGIKSSALGFGCASILGSVDAKKARRALDCAIEYGINHFDLARSYGYGEAEAFVGKILKGRRSSMILASKFGIRANWKAKMLRPAKPVLRFIIDKLKDVPDSKPTSNKAQGSALVIANSMHYRIVLNNKEMRKSLEQSLRSLRTEYLDYFFIHEPKKMIINIDELKYNVEGLKSEGKIRGWGLAFMRAEAHLHKAYLNSFDLLQFDNSPGAINYKDVVSNRGLLPNIFFSPLRGGIEEMRPAEKLQKLNHDFPNSVVLCSMFTEQHIIENATLFS